MQTAIKNKFSLSLLASPSSIVMATDLTDIERLLPHAIAQAKQTGAHITLVHALAIPDNVLLGGKMTLEQTHARQQADKILENAAHHAQAQGIRCSTVLREGNALDIVLEETELRQATRLIIGSHGHGYAGQQILGHVANALLRSVNFPVFAIGPHASGSAAHTTPRRILHPVSLTGNYRETAAFALQLAQAYDAELTLLHVMDSGLLRGAYVKEIVADKHRQLAELIPPQHLSFKINTVVACGDTILEVLKLGSAAAIDWILIGLGHDFLWWSMSNNAAYQVIAQAEWPVITFRTHDAAYKPFPSLDRSVCLASGPPDKYA
jgi:nucleotide-binding universal stress UspA family protein